MHHRNIKPEAPMALFVIVSISVQGELKIPFGSHVHDTGILKMVAYLLSAQSVTASVHAIDPKHVFQTTCSSSLAFRDVWLYPTSSEIEFSFSLQLCVIHMAIKCRDIGILSAATASTK
jgi:hypothetical protein